MYSAALHRYMEFSKENYLEKLENKISIFDTPHDVPIKVMLKLYT